MSNEERDSITRSEFVRREQRTSKEKKLDRLLNVLITIVVILIVINLMIIFNDDGKEIAQENVTDKTIDKVVVDDETDPSEVTKEEVPDDNSQVTQFVISPSDDPIVEELIVDATWEVTPTKQKGEHVSSYDRNHIDYKEKLETFLNAVNLTEQETIFWSVRNNGSTTKSKAVLSTRDKTKMYRVSIEWVDNEGWKPVQVERLKQLEGAY